MNKYYKKIPSRNRYREFIMVLNGVLQLTEREIDVLSTIMSLETSGSDYDVDKKGILNRKTRRYIMDNEHIYKTNLSKYETRFKEKGIIYKEDGKTSLNPLFRASELDNKINVEFILDYNE